MKTRSRNREAFTMIELIFVIVIIGILAAVAIPKLAATRDDAKASAAVMNLGTCVQDIGSQYTAQGTDSIANSMACQNIENGGCWDISDDGDDDGNLTITPISSTESWCVAAQKQAIAIRLKGTHVFGGANVDWD